jgi:hypothetical protein
MCYNCHIGANTGGHPGIAYTEVRKVCVTCHTPGNPYGLPWPPTGFTFHNDFTGTDLCVVCHNPHTLAVDPAQLPKPHFNPITSYVNPNYTAMYVTPRTQCSYCHGTPLQFQTPPTSASQARSDWAASGKGDVTAVPWKNGPTHDWKTSGTAGASAETSAATDCVRCHTSTGYVQYVTSIPNFTNISPVGLSTDKTSEPLTCNGCHNSDFSVRTIGPVTAYFNYSTKRPHTNPGTKVVAISTFYASFFGTPFETGASKLCISCHAGRTAGDTIKVGAVAAGVDFNNVDFINSHYMAAAGVMYANTGYHFYSDYYYKYSNETNFNYQHEYIGTDFTYVPTEVQGTNGPCVNCHMTTPNKHSFYPVTFGDPAHATITNVTYPYCGSCHAPPVGTAPWLQDKKNAFAASLNFFQYVLNGKGIVYSSIYPYFYTAGGTAITAWGNPDTMGAAFNFNYLKREPGAYIHNDYYAKRLIFDSIDFLQNGRTNPDTLAGTISFGTYSTQSHRDYLKGYLTIGGARY